MLKDGIETHGGKTNPHVLLIAPHGYPDPDNDENTGALVREMQKILDCPAIINEVYRKPRKISENSDIYEAPSLEDKILDLNRREHAEMHPSFIKDIEKAIEHSESIFVLWIHGISDVNLKNESELLGEKNSFHCLIGYGQPRQRSCHKTSPERILRALETAEIKTAFTRDNAKKYRGHSPTNMNQWFKQCGYKLNRVQSIQLEFGYEGLRNPKSVDKTAQKLASALLSLNGTLKIVRVEKAPDKSLVADSLNHLSEFFNGSYHNAMQQAGDLIIETFYGRDPQRVLQKNPVLKESLYSLINKLQEGGDKVPSKSWFYNARDLAAHEQIFKKRGFQIFGNLGHSHKLALLPVKKVDKIQELAAEAVKKKYNVAQLKERAREVQNESKEPKKTKSITLKSLRKQKDLEGTSPKKLKALEKQAKEKIENYQSELKSSQERLEWITQAIKALPAKSKKTKRPQNPVKL